MSVFRQKNICVVSPFQGLGWRGLWQGLQESIALRSGKQCFPLANALLSVVRNNGIKSYLCTRKIKKTVNLIIDIGNTAAKIALFEGTELLDVTYDSNRTLESLPDVCRCYPIEKAIVATVIDLTDEAEARLAELPCPLLRLGADTPLPVENLYETPRTLGYDRMAAVVGAADRFPGKDILVIDAGTCITYELVDAAGRYHGGNISPGLQMRFKALNCFTGRLPLVAPEGRLLPMGKDTETAIRGGVLRGIEYEMQGYIRELKKKYPALLVFLTGGDEFSFDTNLKSIIFADKFLVLKGLNRILIYNNDRI